MKAAKEDVAEKEAELAERKTQERAAHKARQGRSQGGGSKEEGRAGGSRG